MQTSEKPSFEIIWPIDPFSIAGAVLAAGIIVLLLVLIARLPGLLPILMRRLRKGL